MLYGAPDGQLWMPVRDGDPSAMALFLRHYSCTNRSRRVYQFVGPGEKLVLLTPCARALFVWRKERDEYRMDGQHGVNCAVFRNEGAPGVLSSDLIRAADQIAFSR